MYTIEQIDKVIELARKHEKGMDFIEFLETKKSIIDQLESVENNDPFDVYKPVQISRRDYFAAMAMQAFIAKYDKYKDIIEDSIFIADNIISELDKPRK